MRLTLSLTAGLLIFETLLGAFLQRVDSALPGRTPASDMPKLPDVLARCLRVFVLIVVGVALSKAWVVHVLGLVDASEWNTLTLELRTAGATLFVAFVIWELLKFVTDPYVAPKPQKASDGGGSGPAASPSASRLSTLVPLLRVALGIVIGLVAVLIVLADFGVNITPLLAGASILGLAVSFGSQALVKDIVSGIFYLTDDAFRAGEYIECGQTKGIVEGFTLRSIRLRHPSGQLRCQLSPQHRHRESAPRRGRHRQRTTRRSGLPAQNPGTAQDAGCRGSHRQYAGRSIQVCCSTWQSGSHPAQRPDSHDARISGSRHRVRQRDGVVVGLDRSGKSLGTVSRPQRDRRRTCRRR
jgi:hypothetical protein